MKDKYSKSAGLEGARRERRAEGAARGGSGARRERHVCTPRSTLRCICSSDAGVFAAMADAEASATMADEAKPDSKTLQILRDMANRLRIHSIRATCASSSG